MNIRDFFWAYVDIWVESNKGSAETQDQCIDLWRTYNRKVIEAPDIFGNPPDIWANYQQDFYEKIPNTPDGVPQLGDVVIWGKSYGGYGHISICTEIANKSTFTSFDQNDPIGEACHFQPHSYTGVLGWLRPKNQASIQPHDDTTLQDKISDLETKVTSLNESLAKALLENNELRTVLANQETDNKDLTDQLLESRTQRDQAIREKETFEKTTVDLTEKVNQLQEGITTRDEEIAGLKSALGALTCVKLADISTKELYSELFYRLFHKRK